MPAPSIHVCGQQCVPDGREHNVFASVEELQIAGRAAPAAALGTRLPRKAVRLPGQAAGQTWAPQEPSFTNGTYGRQGSLRNVGTGGRPVGTSTPGTIGSVRLEGIAGENATDSVAVLPGGSVC